MLMKLLVQRTKTVQRLCRNLTVPFDEGDDTFVKDGILRRNTSEKIFADLTRCPVSFGVDQAVHHGERFTRKRPSHGLFATEITDDGCFDDHDEFSFGW